MTGWLYIIPYTCIIGCLRSLPCSLLLSPLCDVCPPLDGPGVPPERVEAVSSWSLFHEVCAERERERQSVNKAHNQASDHRETHTGYSPMLQRQLALSDVPRFIVFHPISRPYNITRQFSQHSLQERLNQTLSLSILMTPHNRWLPYRHFFSFHRPECTIALF